MNKSLSIHCFSPIDLATIATFSGIQKRLETCIAESTSSIQIAVAWFTNKELLGLLTDKAAKGVAVEIISSDDIINQRLKTQDFIRVGGNRSVCSSTVSRFLHEKFAIFDNRRVVTGSYNWTYAAEHHNHESVIISDDATLIAQYQKRFQNLAEAAASTQAMTWSNERVGQDTVAEEELQQLEEDLKQRFLQTLTEAKKLKIHMQYDSVRDNIERYGAIGVAKRLFLTGEDNVQSGFRKLCEENRQDLTFESIVLEDKYSRLLNENVRDQARKRLRK